MSEVMCSRVRMLMTHVILITFGIGLISGNVLNLRSAKEFSDGFRKNRFDRSPATEPLLEPSIMVLGENIDSPREGDTVTLHCHVEMPDGTEPLYVRWTFGSAILTQDELLINANIYRFVIIKTEAMPGRPLYTLIISNILRSEFGEYRCVVGFDPVGGNGYPMQMWAKIEVNVNMKIENSDLNYVTDYLNPICTAHGGIRKGTWLEGQNINVECRVETDDPGINLDWIWDANPGISKFIDIDEYVENGNTSISFQVTANTIHDMDIFVCTATNPLSFPGIQRNCSIGPIRVIHHMPTSPVAFSSLRPDATSNYRDTSGKDGVTSTLSITLPSNPNNTAVVIVGVILAVMLLVLLLTAIFVIWVRKKRGGKMHAPRRIASNACTSSTEYSTPSSLGQTSKLKLESKLSNLDDHKYDIIHEITPYAQPKASTKKRAAVPYAIAEIQSPTVTTADDVVTNHDYVQVQRESPDGASQNSFEGFVDNILYESTEFCDVSEYSELTRLGKKVKVCESH